MSDAQGDQLPSDHWQGAWQSAGELTMNRPTPAPGTAIYICTKGIDHPPLVLLRAFARAAEHAGYKVTLLQEPFRTRRHNSIAAGRGL